MAISAGIVPPNSNQVPGAVNVPVLQIVVNNPGTSAVNLSTLTLGSTGTGVDNTGITSVDVYLDNNGNGIVDLGIDTYLNSSVYPSNNGNTVVNILDSVPAGGTATFLVAYNFSPTAPPGTYSPTFNSITGLAGTNAQGAVNFGGASLTSAVITIVASTSTPTNTPMNTATATPETVNVTLGTSSPSNSTQLPGTAGVAMIQVQALNTGAANADITNWTFTASGTGNDQTGISLVSLYLDTNNDGIGDTLLATGTYGADNGTLTLIPAVLNPIPPAGANHYVVVYNFSGTAPAGTYQLNIAANNDLVGFNGSTLQPLLIIGAPVSGAVITSANATPTWTNTPSITPTMTATFTATSTATPAPDEKPVVFPNPSDGTKPVMVDVNLTQATDTVTVQVYTVAFRKVQETKLTAGSPGVTASLVGGVATHWRLPVPTNDNWGTPLASGLYYVVVTHPTGRTFGKMLIER